jgi:hypothetical protein
MQIRNWLAKWFTRGYVRMLNFNGVSREEPYQANGEKQDVFWVNAENWPFAGQYTLFGTILLNEHRLNDAPDDIVDYVFLHEVGHAKLPTIIGLITIFIRLPLLILAIIGVPALIARWIGFAFSSPSIDQFLVFSAITVLMILLILVPMITIWWLDEGHAELFVVSKLGVKEYKKRHEIVDDYADRDFITRLIRWTLYPNPEHVVWVANRRS